MFPVLHRLNALPEDVLDVFQAVLYGVQVFAGAVVFAYVTASVFAFYIYPSCVSAMSG